MTNNSGRPSPPEPPNPPAVDAVAPSAPQRRTPPAGALGESIRRAITQLHTVQGDREYHVAIGELRQSPDAAARSLTGMLDSIADDEYLHRWTLTKVLADLTHPAALSALMSIATEAPLDPHGLQVETAAQDGMIRITAIEGIVAQARAGDAEAKKLLLLAVRSPVFSVRQAAAIGYLHTGGDKARPVLEAALPEAERWVLDARPLSAADLALAVPPMTADTESIREMPAPPSSPRTRTPVKPTDDAPRR